MIEKLAWAVYNDVVGGLSGIVSNPNISIDQIREEIHEERLLVIKDYSLRNLLPRKDLMMSINCIKVDCKSLDKCPCGEEDYSQLIAHFEIPQVLNDVPGGGIEFIGSIDKSVNFIVYTSTAFQNHKYKKRGANKPYVYIETTPNENNLYDGWIFNAPMIEMISAIIIPKNLEQVSLYNCCANEDLENYTFLSSEIKKRLVEKKIRYYRQFYQPPVPNNQVAK